MVLAGGAPVPENTRLLVSREKAWDSMQVTLDKDGGFDTGGIPAETVSLSVRLKGYRVSPQNKSLDPMNRRILGRVDRDITNFVYLLEEGAELRPDFNLGGTYEWPGDKPLRGAEGGVDHSREWKITGRVLDSETREPVEQFRATSGETDAYDRTSWDTLHAFDGTNGALLVYVPKRFADPMIKVEADGYLPQAIRFPGKDSEIADIVLKRGSGPGGTVLAPDGTPAIGAGIILIGAGYNQASVNSKGELMSNGGSSKMVQAGSSGEFSLNPEWGKTHVLAASPNGFAMIPLEALAINPVIQMEALGKITGRLQRTSGPSTNENLDLSFGNVDPARQGINLNNHAVTDSEGRFEFNRVPPGKVQICAREKLAGANQGGWASTPLKVVDLKPGEALDVDIETTDRTVPAVSSHQPPELKAIPGVEVKGIVLSPDGKPAADAEVALQIEGRYLALGRGTLNLGGSREVPWFGRTATDGSFTLPMYEKAEFLLAVNSEGFLRTSLESLKASPRITLQQWGSVEGTLEINGQIATNQLLSLRSSPDSNAGTFYDPNAFQFRTDDQGRFAVAFVPPGNHTIAKRIPLSANSSMSRTVSNVEVKPGETARVKIIDNGRAVVGKIVMNDTNDVPDFREGHVALTPRNSQQAAVRQASEAPGDLKAYLASIRAMAAANDFRQYAATLSVDGSFRAEGVPPGDYDLIVDPYVRSNGAIGEAACRHNGGRCRSGC